MSFIEFSKKLLKNYFIIVTGITMAIAFLGMNMYPNERIPYDAFLSPLILGIVAILPSYIFYSKNELTFKQMLFRKILHFILLVITQLGFAYVTGLLKNAEVTFLLAISVFAVYLFTMGISWIIDSKTAIDINRELKKMRE
ncbi:hypothetical protein bsdtb5_20890 [Anaeromicropila herbilytica]|uniref:DUF3021 domain-containing protein n=1 Tax=Anaeromicropila herbilytica TaxID=2785025 RepID=A0A7R7EL66_9FIRM|nr:hypothetical protein bsdtb5_20890 [Anaeromicropila herbilytica]